MEKIFDEVRKNIFFGHFYLRPEDLRKFKFDH
jgi:hypothetical protein